MPSAKILRCYTKPGTACSADDRGNSGQCGCAAVVEICSRVHTTCGWEIGGARGIGEKEEEEEVDID